MGKNYSPSCCACCNAGGVSVVRTVVELAERMERSARDATRATAATYRELADISSRTWERVRPPNSGPRLAPGSMEPLHGWTAEPSELDPDSNDDLRPEIAVLVYRGVSSSEVQMVGDALARPFGARVRLVSADPGSVVAIEPARMIVAEPLSVVARPYGLVIPGGLAWKREAERPEVIAWLSEVIDNARGVIAVSTGSLLLAAIGALDGQSAAGHWLAADLMAEMGAEPSTDRFVHGRLIATASGALAGVDAAEALAKEMRFSV